MVSLPGRFAAGDMPVPLPGMAGEVFGWGDAFQVLDPVIAFVLVDVVDVIAVGDRTVVVFPNGPVEENPAVGFDTPTVVAVFASPVSVAFPFNKHVEIVSSGVRKPAGFHPDSVQNGWSAVQSSVPTEVTTSTICLIPVGSDRVT